MTRIEQAPLQEPFWLDHRQATFLHALTVQSMTCLTRRSPGFSPCLSQILSLIDAPHRSQFHADAWCRISSYLSAMAALGYNLLVAIQITRTSNAVRMIDLHDSQATLRTG